MLKISLPCLCFLATKMADVQPAAHEAKKHTSTCNEIQTRKERLHLSKHKRLATTAAEAKQLLEVN